MYKRILIPTDGSSRSNLAVEEGIRLAQKLNSEIVAFHVIPVVPVFLCPFPEGSGEAFKVITEELEKNGSDILQKIKEKYADSGVNVETKLTRGNAAYEICKEAKEGRYDLIIMANRGLGEIKGYLMGSVSNRVVRHAGCSVFIVK